MTYSDEASWHLISNSIPIDTFNRVFHWQNTEGCSMFELNVSIDNAVYDVSSYTPTFNNPALTRSWII